MTEEALPNVEDASEVVEFLEMVNAAFEATLSGMRTVNDQLNELIGAVNGVQRSIADFSVSFDDDGNALDPETGEPVNQDG